MVNITLNAIGVDIRINETSTLILSFQSEIIMINLGVLKTSRVKSLSIILSEEGLELTAIFRLILSSLVK